jgi:hypothetical protein
MNHATVSTESAVQVRSDVSACPTRIGPHFSDIWTDAQHSRTAFFQSFFGAAWQAVSRSLTMFSRNKNEAEPRKLSMAPQGPPAALPQSIDRSESQAIRSTEIIHWFLSFGG